MTAPTGSQRMPPTVEPVAVRAHEATVIVGGVRVRWVIQIGIESPSPRWKCDIHGTGATPICDHAAHAAAAIARTLLGLPAEVTTPARKRVHQ